MANGYELVGDYDNSVREYERLLTKKLSMSWELFCKFVVAQIYIERGDDEKGIAILRHLIADHRQHPNWPPACHYRLAGYYKDHGNVEQARKELQQIISNYPNRSLVEKATARLVEWR